MTLAGSVAIDAALDYTGRFGFPLTEDQRGVAPPQGAACDSGAFERAAAPLYSAPADQSTLEGTPTLVRVLPGGGVLRRPLFVGGACTC